jgi:hypothetical protein
MKTFLFKKRNFRHIFGIGAMVCATLFLGCEKDDEPENPDKPGNPNVENPVDVVMKNASVSGVVRDTDGNFLEGVTVSTGTRTTITNVAGLFLFQEVGTVDSRSVIRFEKEGYFPITRSGANKTEINMEVVLHSKGNSDISARTNFDASSAKTLSVGNMKVNVPASSIVKKDGTSYSGSVNADMLYLDPNNEDFNELMPGGDLAAVRTDNSTAQLISYGMTEVSLTDNAGNPLQLAEGAKSEMTFPIPAGMESNPPATIPLWYFNENTGLWVEEGTATLQGNVYVGAVEHFSWHNLDYPEDRVTIKGVVKDCNSQPLANVKVTVDQTSDITNSRGEYSVYVPANTPVTVTVLSKDYQNYSPEVSYPVAGTPGGQTVTQNVNLPCTPKVKGRLINSCGEIAAAYVWLEYTQNGKKQESQRVWVNTLGDFEIRVLSTVTGQATVWAEALDGTKVSKTVTLTGDDLLNVSIEFCMDISESSLTVTPENGTPILVPIDWANTISIVSDEGLSIVNGTMSFMLFIEDYSKDRNSFDNVTVAIISSSLLFSTEKAHVDVISQTDERIKLSISGIGECVDMTTFATVTGSIGGIIDAPITMIISSDDNRNVTDWSKVGLPATFPTLPTPIDLVISMTAPFNVKNLYYKNKTESDYNEIKAILTAGGLGNGFEEITENGETSISYMAGDYIVVVIYDPNGAYNDDEGDYTLMVSIMY